MLYFKYKSHDSTTNYGRVITQWIFHIDICQNNKSDNTVSFPESSLISIHEFSDSHTAENIVGEIKDVLAKWNLPVHGIVAATRQWN